MSFLSKPATTTILLAVNALLLLTLVVQNATRTPPHPPMMSAETPFHGGGGENPHESMPMGQDGNFDPTLMIMAALKCPGQPAMTLDSQECSGNKADDMRASVHDIYGEQQSIRGVFDAIVKKYGESALTNQAMEIRKSRRAGK